MIKESYIKLGEFIEQCNERNINEYYGADELRGINNEGNVMPSKANIIGVSFHTYKIAHKGYFIYNPARLDIGSISCLQEEVAIFSQMYVIFKIKEKCKNTLLTEYLWMWFKRKEFFRYVAFVNFGSVREMFTYEDMCNVMLPVPPIEEQRRIVSEYQTVERRIANNEALIQKLEETAQAIYHHTFVEGIDEENLPEGWRKDVLYDIAEFLNGKPCQNFATIESNFIPVLKIRELGLGYTDKDSDKVVNTFPKEYIIHYGDLVFSWSASLFVDFWCYKEVALNQHLFKVTSNEFPLWFCYLWIKYHISIWKNIITAKAVSMGHIKKNDLQSAVVFIPTKKEMQDLDSMIAPLFNYMMNLKRENIHLRTLLSLLTSKLS